MFIHIGDENVIRSKDIVSIIDLNVIDSSPIIEEMIAHHQQSGRLIGSKKMQNQSLSHQRTSIIVHLPYRL